jgi:drug/metabolite transporter (DMT)-like permease
MIAAGRLLLASLILTPIVWAYHRQELRKLNRRETLMSIAGGLWLASHFILLITALEYTSVMLNQVLLNTAPIWTALAETFFSKARLSKWVWLGLALAFAGGVFIAVTSADTGAVGSNPMLGNLLAILGAIAGTIYTLLSHKVRETVSLIPYNWMAFTSGGFMALGYALISGKTSFSHNTDAYFWLLMLTLVPQLIGHSGYNYALRYMQATFVSLVFQILTVTSALAAFFIFGELPTRMEIIGSIIIVVGVMIAINAPKVKLELSTELQA